jgi:RNA methyltransferase, TrmH family
VISSTKNPRVASIAKLKKRGLREQAGRFLVEGAQAAGEALAAGAVDSLFHVPGSTGRVPEVVSAAEASEVEVVAVSDAVMAYLTSAVTPQGVVAVAPFVDVPMAELSGKAGLVPVLCSVRDPGNAGAIIRSADAAGADGVIVTTASVDVYNAKTVRASAGSLFHLPLVREVQAEEAVAALRAGGAQVFAAAADGELSAYEADLSRPTALLLGNEAWGLTPEVRALADAGVRVPIAGRAESLNLAAAAALLMFEWARRRGESSSAPDDLAHVVRASAHDLRLPLTALKGFASTLADRWDRFDDADRRQMLESMLLDIERTSGMIGLLVDSARLAQDSLHSRGERGDVAEVMKAVADLFARSPEYPGVQVAGGARTAVDRERLQAILLALCDGALWWGHEGPIRIEARSEGGHALIEVRRRGGGPDQAEVRSMFAGPGSNGSRIGLYLAGRLVEALGGALSAEGGDGVTYRLSLPA